MEELLRKQKLAIEKLNDWVRRFDDTQAEERLMRTTKDRIKKMEAWLKEFNRRNTELIPFTTNEQPYFKDDIYTAALQKYCEFMEKLQTQVNLEEEIASHIELSSGDEEKSDDNNMSGNGSEPSDNESGNGNDEEHNDFNEEIKVKVNTVKLQRKDLKDIFSTIDSMNSNTSNGYAKAQLEMAKIVWEEFRKEFQNLRLLNVDIDKKVNFKQLQRQYVMSIGKLNDICAKKNGENYEVKLPKINIPEFSGKQDEWQPFIELFEKIVHDQQSLSDSTKI